MDLYTHFKENILVIGGPTENTASVWKICRYGSGIPFTIKEFRLDKITGGYEGVTCLYFKSDDGEEQFTYAHHMNHDWYPTRREAYDAAWDSLTTFFVLNKKHLEELEVIQHNLSQHPAHSSKV